MAKRTTLELPAEGIRQSLLAGFELCGRRTRFALEQKGDWSTGYVEVSADLGKMFHLFAAKYLRTLWKSGAVQMERHDAEEVLWETYAEAGFVLPSDEREDLLWLARGFCHFKWNATRVLALEERLEVGLGGLDGQIRPVTGQPDVLMSDPPRGLVIVDYKSGRSRPPSPRGQRDVEYAEGKQYLSERGHFQLDCYGMLALHAFPTMDYVILRELHLRTAQVREATLRREELPRVERELALHAQMLERAIDEGPKSELFRPRAGAHCARQCPVSRSCPIPREQRGVGAIATDKQQDEASEAFAVVHAQQELLRKQLKERHEATGRAGQLSDGKQVRWHENGSGGRSFGICDADAPLDPKTVEAIFQNTGQNLEELLEKSLEQVKA